MSHRREYLREASSGDLDVIVEELTPRLGGLNGEPIEDHPVGSLVLRDILVADEDAHWRVTEIWEAVK